MLKNRWAGRGRSLMREPIKVLSGGHGEGRKTREATVAGTQPFGLDEDEKEAEVQEQIAGMGASLRTVAGIGSDVSGAGTRNAFRAGLAEPEQENTEALSTLPLSPKEECPLVFSLMEELRGFSELEYLVLTSDSQEEFYREVSDFITKYTAENSGAGLAERYRTIIADPAQHKVLQATLAFYWWGGEAGYQIFGSYPGATPAQERGNMGMNFVAFSLETGEKVFCKIMEKRKQFHGLPASVSAEADWEGYLLGITSFLSDNAINSKITDREQKRIITEALAGLGVQGEHFTPTNKPLIYKDTLAGVEVRFEEGFVLLEKLLEQEDTFSFEQKITLLIETLRGLNLLHTGKTIQRGDVIIKIAPVVHRDLKPANIFVKIEDNGKIKVRIFDFGIAKMPDQKNLDATKTGTVIGTLDYIPAWRFIPDSPARNSFAVDVWAVFEIGYQLLTGEHSHFRKMPNTLLNLAQTKGLETSLDDINRRLSLGDISPQEISHATIMTKVKGGPDFSALQEIPEADPALLTLFTKGLARKPEEAFKTAAEAMQALRDWLRNKKYALPMQLGNLAEPEK